MTQKGAHDLPSCSPSLSMYSHSLGSCFVLTSQSHYCKKRRHKGVPHRVYSTNAQAGFLPHGCVMFQSRWEFLSLSASSVKVIPFKSFPCVFVSFRSTASALSSPGAGRPERLSVHSAPPELRALPAPIQRQRRSFSRIGPRHLHRCTLDQTR